MEEIWKKIEGYEGLYEISNKGRVKSLINGKEKIIKNQENSRGYLRVQLTKNKIKKRYFVHRLVAKHFLKKPKEFNIVNHLDCNIQNNEVNNLEWTTYKGNSNYMKKMNTNIRTKKWIENLTRSERKLFGKPVIRISMIDLSEKRYECLNQVKEDGFQPSCVSQCCKNLKKYHKGYMWKFGGKSL